MAASTLRELSGFGDTPASLKDATLLMIDYQNTYTTGTLELEGWESALEAAADLLSRARAAGATVIHVVNDGGTGTLYDLDAEVGRIHAKVAPIDGEAVVAKAVPNGFVGTNLAQLVDVAGHHDIVIAGFMTHMCVQATAAGAFLVGKTPTVVADASATRPLQTAVAAVPAEQLHNSALATIADLYGVVVKTATDLR